MVLTPSRRSARALAAAAVATATVLGAMPAASASASTHPGPPSVQPIFSRVMPGVNLTNTHWSGYDATHGGYKAVQASWTQPSVNCSEGGYVVFWVGLGGGTATSDSLQQNGTEVNCSSGSPVYNAWWETWPCNFITTYGGIVKPGDQITASTINEGGNKYEFKVSDPTEGWSVSPTHTGCNGGSMQTAEVITETPRTGSGYTSLPDFGKVTYTSATINNAALASADPTKVIMARKGVVMDQTTAISGGNSFSNIWKKAHP